MNGEPRRPGHRGDDGLMHRFDLPALRRYRARDAIIAVGVAALLLVLLTGPSIRRSGEEMQPGWQRDLVLVVGKPAGWLADKLPLAHATDRLTSWLSPDDDLGDSGGFAGGVGRANPNAVAPITPQAFDPAQLGSRPPPRRSLHRLLVTGDSMVMPLDLELARRLSGDGVDVIRDPHVGTGISKSLLVDWGKLAAVQVRRDKPDAVVVFLGANEGFPMRGPDGREVSCCGPRWAAVYATRVRFMMNVYRRRGVGRVYWLTLPTPREGARQTIARTVNAAIDVAAEPWREQVRVVDTVPIFTPGDHYRDAMTVGGEQTIVRESDGIHLNGAGSAVAAGAVLRVVGRDFRT